MVVLNSTTQATQASIEATCIFDLVCEADQVPREKPRMASRARDYVLPV
jgi:hypothetical protein